MFPDGRTSYHGTRDDGGNVPRSLAAVVAVVAVVAELVVAVGAVVVVVLVAVAVVAGVAVRVAVMVGVVVGVAVMTKGTYKPHPFDGFLLMDSWPGRLSSEAAVAMEEAKEVQTRYIDDALRHLTDVDGIPLSELYIKQYNVYSNARVSIWRGKSPLFDSWISCMDLEDGSVEYTVIGKWRTPKAPIRQSARPIPEARQGVCPYKAYLGSVFSNLRQELDSEIAQAIRDEEGYAHHHAWDFCGKIWRNNGAFHEEIWIHHEPVALYSALALAELIQCANDKHGSA